MNNLFECIKTRIEDHSKEYPIRDIVQCGSIAKGTSVDSSDIDIFICFDQSYSWENFKSYIEYLADKLFDSYSIKFATYPYIDTTIKDMDIVTSINIVPCYYTESIKEIKSPVDRTPHHVTWVNENLSIQQKEDVKELKEFLKINGLYGADDYTKGFSGYLCEVLIHMYKSFDDVIIKFAFTTESDTNELPYHILDPIDPKRHLSKAVSNENWAKLIMCCRIYLGYDTIKSAQIDIDGLYKLINPHIILIRHDTEDLPKIRKETKKIVGILRKVGFNVLDSDSKPMFSIICVEYKTLPNIYIKNKIINIVSKDAYINIPKINGQTTIKNIINNDFTISSIRYRQDTLHAKDVLSVNGYKVVNNSLNIYSYKKYLCELCK